MKAFYLAVFVTAVVGLIGCAEQASYKMDGSFEATAAATTGQTDLPESPAANAPKVASPDVLPGAADANRLRVYTGTVDLQVANRDHAINQLKKQTQAVGGYFEVLRSRTVIIRIPAEQFNSYIADLSKIGDIVDRSIQVVDVTNEFHDMQAELKNLESVRERLKDLLKKATNVKDTLEIENELNRVQTRIDQLAGRLERLQRQITYAKLTINLILPNTSSAGKMMRDFTPAYWVNQLGLDSLYR